MQVELCTGGWPADGYRTPLFTKTYSGAQDSTVDNSSGNAGYINNTPKYSFMEVQLIPVMRNIYAYEFSYLVTNPVNGDYVEFGEYDSSNTVTWIRRWTYNSGSWSENYYRIICEGLNVTLYNNNSDKITIPRTKTYGRLFIRLSTSGATEARAMCYFAYTEVSKEMIVNNVWNITPGYTGGFPNYTVDAYLRTETKFDPVQPYYPRYNRIESFTIEIQKPKMAMSVSGTPLSVVQYNTPIKCVFNCVLTDIEIAVWRKHMELPKWGHSNLIHISTMPGIIPNEEYAINSVDFGEEIEYGAGLYKTVITVTIMANTNEATLGQNTSVNQGYPLRTTLYRHNQITSQYNIRNTMQEPIDTVTVRMYHLSVTEFETLRGDVEARLYGYLEYAPPAGTAPFGPHRGDGPFLAKIAGLRATVSNVNRVDAELDLIYYGEA